MRLLGQPIDLTRPRVLSSAPFVYTSVRKQTGTAERSRKRDLGAETMNHVRQSAVGSVTLATRLSHPTTVKRTKSGPAGSRASSAFHAEPMNMPGVIAAVVDGFIDSLQSNGEGVLPIVLALRPQLSMRGIAESDVEFARRGRRQSAAERQFFGTIEAELRQALTRILSDAVRAETGANQGPR